MPCAGAKLYLSAGIAFAAPTSWNSIMESKPSTAFAGSSFVPTSGDGGGPLICERICTPLLEITAAARTRARIRIVHPQSGLFQAIPAYQTFSTVVLTWCILGHVGIRRDPELSAQP